MSRPVTHGLREVEAVIMDLWDDGKGAAAIVAATGQRERYVLDVISRFTSGSDWQDHARAATIKLAAAIAATGGSFA